VWVPHGEHPVRVLAARGDATVPAGDARVDGGIDALPGLDHQAVRQQGIEGAVGRGGPEAHRATTGCAHGPDEAGRMALLAVGEGAQHGVLALLDSGTARQGQQPRRAQSLLSLGGDAVVLVRRVVQVGRGARVSLDDEAVPQQVAEAIVEPGRAEEGRARQLSHGKYDGDAMALLAVGEHAQHVGLPMGRALRRRGDGGQGGKRHSWVGEQRLAARGNAVVPPALVLRVGRGPWVLLGDQAVLQHARDGAVERTGREDDLAVRGSLDRLHDGVAVALLPIGERPQDVVAIRDSHISSRSL